MRALILCVGRLRERWQADGCQEYLKRLSRYGRYEVQYVDDAPDPPKPSPALLARAMDAEGAQLLKWIRPEDYVVALCIDAPRPSSPGLADRVRAWSASGRRTVLVIGGSNGLSEKVLARADERLSFSPMTFPHGLMRVILLEQLYRAERILAGEKYHK